LGALTPLNFQFSPCFRRDKHCRVIILLLNRLRRYSLNRFFASLRMTVREAYFTPLRLGELELFGDGVEDDLFCIFEWAGQCESCGDFVPPAAVLLGDSSDVNISLAAKRTSEFSVGKLDK